MELTESEIMRALTICTTKGASCKDCPAFVKVDRSNCKKVFRGAIDLINRKNAEIERFEKEYDRLFKDSLQHKTEVERLKKLLDTECDTCACGLLEQRDKARTEAIKEFADRVKAKHRRMTDYDEAGFGCQIFIVEENIIDQIAKEMGVEL